MKTFSILAILLLTVSLAFSQGSTDKDTLNYTEAIKIARQKKDEEFRTDALSAITQEARKDFRGLNYFYPDSSYRVIASLKKYDNPFHFRMKTTTDRLPEYALYGKATFVLKGQEMSLNVYQNVELLKKPGYQNYLFIPFNDSTNGVETYGGGRFIDGENTGRETILLDFNTAYNPYCAYNHKYSCPIPPEENSLPVRIEAGEKKWHD